MDRSTSTGVVGIERGEIVEKKADTQAGYIYKVRSFTRDGITSRWMEAVNAGVNEYKGEPPVRSKYQYSIGDEVNYFMFDDGRGMIVGKARRDLE